ncbi:hypothetical protein CR513_35915, partial [Mucuna pruriens]
MSYYHFGDILTDRLSLVVTNRLPLTGLSVLRTVTDRLPLMGLYVPRTVVGTLRLMGSLVPRISLADCLSWVFSAPDSRWWTATCGSLGLLGRSLIDRLQQIVIDQLPLMSKLKIPTHLQNVQKWVGGISGDQIVLELNNKVSDGKNSEITFDNFPYYLSQRIRLLLTSAEYVYLKQEFSKHMINLFPAGRSILLSGPAELYQQMLAQALAHYFESKLLSLESIAIENSSNPPKCLFCGTRRTFAYRGTELVDIGFCEGGAKELKVGASAVRRHFGKRVELSVDPHITNQTSTDIHNYLASKTSGYRAKTIGQVLVRSVVEAVKAQGLMVKVAKVLNRNRFHLMSPLNTCGVSHIDCSYGSRGQLCDSEDEGHVEKDDDSSIGQPRSNLSRTRDSSDT